MGLPLVGTGYGGAHDIKGHVVRDLLAELYEAAKFYDVDLVLVTNEVHAFVAAQNARRQYGASVANGARSVLWHDLDGNLLLSADGLAGHARRCRLVLFLGAGVSVGAGLPGWEHLLADLAADAEMEPAEQAALKRVHTLDRAAIIESRLAARGIRLGERIAERFVASCYSLTHSLLASLPIAEVVTTNYDCLFERASEAAGCKLAVLPYQSVVDRSRWLLKMHGCITHPEDIVLTRETYLRYAERRAALFGIVQALLITRHMLFVGFSLTDDNFHRIADDVRKAVRSSDDEKKQINHFGTAIFLLRDRLMEELWQNDLHRVSMDNNGKANTADAARRLEIFLDYLLAEATHATSPLLDHAYDGVLTDEEREIRVLLRALQSQATSRIRSSPAWEPIAELLRRLGG